MALRFFDGFEGYTSVADLYQRWTGSGLSHGVSAVASVTWVTIGATGRNGSNGLSMGASGGNFYMLRKGMDNQATWILGFAVKFGTIGANTPATPLATFLDAASIQNTVSVNPSGLLCWYRGDNATLLGTGTTTLTTGVFYYIEIMSTCSSSISSGQCVARINGVAEITLAAATNTRTSSNSYANIIELNVGAFTNSAQIHVFDDVYLCDLSGSVNNAFLGDVRVESLLPTGNGTYSQWTPSAGSNYACVDEAAANGDTDYVSASSLTLIDTYTFPALSSSPSSVFGVQTVIDCRKDDAGSRGIAAVIRSGSADYAGATVSVGDSYSANVEIRELNPSGSVAWTGASVNAMEAGVKLVL